MADDGDVEKDDAPPTEEPAGPRIKMGRIGKKKKSKATNG
jgi:hypothetical protein